MKYDDHEDTFQEVEFSTAEDLDEAIESTEFINHPWLPRGYVTLLVDELSG